MRYRVQSAEDDDYMFGQGNANFYINNAAAVAQAVLTRLRLWLGEWFIDPSDGTPWLTQITGTHTQGIRDIAIKQRVLGTPGVISVANYFSTIDPYTRHFTVQMMLNTVYGDISLDEILSLQGHQ